MRRFSAAGVDGLCQQQLPLVGETGVHPAEEYLESIDRQMVQAAHAGDERVAIPAGLEVLEEVGLDERASALRHSGHPPPCDVEHFGAVIDTHGAPEAGGVAQQHLAGAASQVEHRFARCDMAVERGEQQVVRKEPRLRVDVIVDRRRLPMERDVVVEVLLPALVHGSPIPVRRRHGSARNVT